MGKYQIVKSVKMNEGEGAKVNRVFPTNNYNKHHDPFVLMDEFFVEAPAAFPPHEHRGFEAISYMLDGSFKHEDNQGNKREVKKGGIQAFNAGKSIVHSEAPGEDGLSHGIQLWLKLPEKFKQSDPEYFQVNSKDMKVIEEEGLYSKIVIDNNTPINLHTDLVYKDIKINKDKEYNLKLDNDMLGIVYLLEGKLEIDGKESIKASESILLNKNDKIKLKSLEKSRFIELKGKPHNENIRIRGSFVE